MTVTHGPEDHLVVLSPLQHGLGPPGGIAAVTWTL
jgi:hypothetical protein